MIRWFIDTDDLDEAWRRVPWAAEILECEGGFWAFESVADAMQWENNQPGDAISDDEARRRQIIKDACDRAFNRKGKAMTEWQERFVAFLVGLGLVALTAVIAGI